MTTLADAVAAMVAIARSIPKPEFSRIVAGAPLVAGDRAWKDTRRGILWISEGALETITLDAPIGLPGPVNRLMGIEVERFTWTDHGDLWRGFMRELLGRGD